MEGYLDELEQAFLKFDIGQNPLDFLVDTGFSGTLLVGKESFDDSRATPSGTMEATLAAGQTCTFECYDIEFDWFGKRVLVQILTGSGKECLLGTIMLRPHRLEIDYDRRTVALFPNSAW